MYVNNRMNCERPPLVVFTCSDAAPFAFHEGNDLTGHDIDLARHIGRKLNRKLQIVDMSFNSLLEQLRLFPESDQSIGITAIAATSQLKKYIDLSQPYYTSRTVLLTSKRAQTTKQEDFLMGKVLMVRHNTIHESYVLENVKSKLPRHLHILAVPVLTPTTIQHLLKGEIYGVFTSLEEAQLFSAGYKDLNIVDLPDAEYHYCVALHKRSSLTPLVNRAIASLRKDGTLQALKEKWLNSAHFVNIRRCFN